MWFGFIFTIEFGSVILFKKEDDSIIFFDEFLDLKFSFMPVKLENLYSGNALKEFAF